MDWDEACCGDSDDSRNPGRSTGLGKRDFLKCLFSSLTVRDSRSCLSSASCKFLNNEAEKKGHMELFYFFGIGVGNKKGRSKMIKMKWTQQFGELTLLSFFLKNDLLPWLFQTTTLNFKCIIILLFLNLRLASLGFAAMEMAPCFPRFTLMGMQ